MNVIQVGIGGMGRAWINAVKRSSDVEYVALVEINPEIAAATAQEFGLDQSMIYASLPEAIAASKADGVIDVTPPQFHREISITALEAGLPVLSEKPLSSSLEDAKAIVETANQTGVLHMVAQNYRYSVAVQTLKHLLDSGEMGPVASVAIEFFRGPRFKGFRAEMAQPLIVDMAIHHFDMMRYLLGKNPVSVFGRSWNPAWSWYAGDAAAALSFEFEDGIVASYDGSWCSLGVETTWNANWRFECEQGVILLGYDKVFIQQPGGVDGINTQHDPLQEVVNPIHLRKTAQDYLLDEFYRAVVQGGAVGTPCQDNINSLAMVFAAVESCETGQVVTI